MDTSISRASLFTMSDERWLLIMKDCCQKPAVDCAMVLRSRHVVASSLTFMLSLIDIRIAPAM